MQFRPFPLLANAHVQTIVGNLLSLAKEPRSTTRLVALPDGDRLALEVSTPDSWRETDPTVALLHGLCGSHRSTYLVRIAGKLVQAGVRAVRLNLRGNGSGAGLARRPYHAGCSDDVRVALESLRAEAPRSPLSLVGFSLGGNIALKLAAELGPDGPALVERVVGVCPAVDLLAGWQRISKQPLYHRHFVRLLLREMHRRHAVSGEPFPQLSPWVSLFDFDDRYTAPHWGHAGAQAYYEAASARHVLSRIGIPCRVLLADDDPIVDSSTFDRVTLPAGAELVRTPRGGHLGFVGAPPAWVTRPDVRYMDDVVLRWVLSA